MDAKNVDAHSSAGYNQQTRERRTRCKHPHPWKLRATRIFRAQDTRRIEDEFRPLLPVRRKL